MEDLQCGPGLGLAHGREVGVNDGGIQRLMAQVLADQAQADAFLKQMRGVGMAQSVSCGKSIDPAGRAGQPISHLHGTDAHEGRRLVHELT